MDASQELGNVIKQSVELWIVALYEVYGLSSLTSGISPLFLTCAGASC